MPLAHPGPLRSALARSFPERPFTVEFWDGGRLESTTGAGPTFSVRSPEAIAHLIRAPGELGFGRAYVSGYLDVDDLDLVMEVIDAWRPQRVDGRRRLGLVLAALPALGLIRPPPVPAAELQPEGARHSKDRDARAVRHHYNVPSEFFALFLDESMTYSCALFSRGADTLEEAQEAKLELICHKLDLEPGGRVLDIGCGWGSFALHAAERHGVDVVGITLSEPQAEVARRRVREAGFGDRIEIRVMDYRDLGPERFDAVVSIGMVEHVGEAMIDVYAQRIADVLEPGGRVLNHGIAQLRPSVKRGGPFSERYVFPDGEPLPVSRVLTAFERAGLEAVHVEALRGDYEETLRHWAERLDANLEEAERLAGPERLRVWRLYLRAARNGFLKNDITVYQVLCEAPGQASDPSTRREPALAGVAASSRSY
jgi:cyclopropane-fatty-acyl-phospholipid synthase